MLRLEYDRHGTSLLELVVALAVGGVILLCARSVMEQVADATQRTIGRGAAAEHRINADRLLRAAVGRIESATIVRSAVRGNRSFAELETWCDVPEGWQERCVVTVRVVTGAEENLLIAVAGSDTIVVRRGFATASLRYLADARYGGVWLSEWVSEITTPFALGVIVDADTLIVRIGERG